jgi:hypothetical protein
MKRRFGHDFSQVRVHTDTRAAESAQAVNAHAYTVGHDVVFGERQHAPQTPQGMRLMAHELTHVVQQSRSSGEEPGGNSANAESQASHAAAQVARGGFVSSNTIGQAPLGIYADDGKKTGVPPSGSSESPSFKLPGPPLVGPLKISSWLVQELIKQGLLSPQMLQLIQSGQIEIAQDKKAPSQTGGGTGNFASEFNALSSRFLGSGGLASRGEPATTPPAPSAPQSITVGGYTDPVLGYIPPHVVTWQPATPSAPQPAGQPNWLQQALADIKTSFSFSEGLSISSLSRPDLKTSIFVTGITQQLFKTRGGVAGQAELGWDRSVGFQLSYRDWFLHGSMDPDGKWGVSLSFPNDAPVPVTPWINDVFREAGVAVQGFTKIAAAGPPNLNNLDPLKKELSPHIDRMKNAVDAAKGIAKAQPGVNFALTVGSGPRPGAAPSEHPSGIFVGGALVGAF